MVGYENWCVKLQLSGPKRDRLNHPVIKYLNEAYKKDHDGTAYYYGVYNNDSFCDSSKKVKDRVGKQYQYNIPILTLEEFLYLKDNKEKTYECW